MIWGFSEALDLLNEYLLVFKKQYVNPSQKCGENSSGNISLNDDKDGQLKEQINILLFGANDPRHIIKTLAKMHSHKGIIKNLNFYIVNGNLEVIARNLVLVAIALENPSILNLRLKVHLFMDVYGNALTTALSEKYLAVKAKSLLKLISDDECDKNLTSIFSFERMKYNERNGLQNVLDFWVSKENHVFNVQEYWNSRIRNQMGARYDYRNGQYDWDLNMVLKERGGKHICSQEYRSWRETGIAFAFPEYEYSKPNKTFATGLVRNGNKFLHRGYLGDMQTGPFIAFGLKSNDKIISKSFHGENDYCATDINERNLLELFYELATKTLYEQDTARSTKYSVRPFQIGQCLSHYEIDSDHVKEFDKPWISLDGIKINFVTPDDILSPEKFSAKWSKFFDVVFVEHNYFAFLQDNFVNILNSQSLLIAETKLFSTAKKEEIKNFEQKILNYAKRNNLKYVVNYDALNSNNLILKFISSSNLPK